MAIIKGVTVLRLDGADQDIVIKPDGDDMVDLTDLDGIECMHPQEARELAQALMDAADAIDGGVKK